MTRRMSKEEIEQIRAKYEEQIGIQAKLLKLLRHGLRKLRKNCLHEETKIIKGKKYTLTTECLNCGYKFKDRTRKK